MIFKKKKQPLAAPKTKLKENKAGQQRFLTAELESILSGWMPENGTIDANITKYQKKMVMRSREQHRKNDYVKRYFQLLKTNIIGADGILMHALLEDSEGNRCKDKNKALEQAWLKWQEPEYCDISGCLDFAQMQQVILTTVAQDGEAIIKIIKDSNNPFGLSLHLIDPQRLDVDKNDVISQSRFIRHGVEFNQYGKPLAYYFLEETEGGTAYQASHVRIPASDIIHLFRSDQVGQKRGFPWVSTALFRMKMLDSYQDAAIINANSSAKKIAFFQKKFNDSSDTEDAPVFQDEHIGYGVIPSGYELVPFDSQYPNGEIEAFTKSILRGISSGLGISYNSLATDLEGVNFSSLRHGAIEERDNYRVMQEWFVAGFLKPLYKKWLKSALVSNAINGFSAADYEDALKVRFQGRRWAWVDPAKEVTAHEKKLAMGVTTRADIIRETGRDPDQVLTQIKHEQEMLAEEGLTYLLHPNNRPSQETANDDDE